VISEGVIAICNSIVNSPVRLIAAEFVASVAVMRFADWSSNSEEARRLSSIRELEALFALEDPRESGSGRRG
jgi:hypothetical protein